MAKVKKKQDLGHWGNWWTGYGEKRGPTGLVVGDLQNPLAPWAKGPSSKRANQIVKKIEKEDLDD